MADNTAIEVGRALVTGGAGDIGRAICRALVDAGWSVVVADIVRPDDARPVLSQALGEDADAVDYHQLDQTSESEVAKFFASAGVFDLAVIAAGTVQAQAFLDIDVTAWRKQIEVNLTGSFLVAQAVAKSLASKKVPGHVIFISSWVAERPWPDIAAYTASKAGLNQLMKQMALELAPLKIRANAVSPGIVLAGLAKGQLENEPEYARRVETAIPLGDLQTAEQISDAVAFLASPAASTMTGTVLLVDSGCSLGQVR
jgi:NAD(P)-dependent dehydrogenase (short-subunit alcohol dehydrogenase family)